MAVAIGIFRDEKIIADQQRRFHRAGRDIEGLEQEGADDERDDKRVKDHAPGFGDTAFLASWLLLSHSLASASSWPAPAAANSTTSSDAIGLLRNQAFESFATRSADRAMFQRALVTARKYGANVAKLYVRPQISQSLHPGNLMQRL